MRTSAIWPIVVALLLGHSNAALSASLVISPTTLAFNVTGGTTQTFPQQIDVNSSGDPINFIVSASSVGNWLTVIGTMPLADGSWAATTPKAVSVFANVANLRPGSSYSGIVTITSSVAQNSPQTVTVSLVIGGAPNLSANPSSLTFVAKSGDSSSQSRSIALSISDPTGMLTFTTGTTGGSWLTVNPGSGLFPNNIDVAVNPTGLSPGTYSASVFVSAIGASNSPLTIPVTLTVTASSSLTIGPSSLSFRYQGDGTLPQSQAVTISASSAMAFTALSSSGSWLSASPTSGTTPSSLSVSVNPVGLNSGVYDGTITVTAPGASNSPQSISVVLTVTVTSGLISSGSMAQLASAGSWTTTIMLVNTGTTAALARLNFFGESGNPLTLPILFPQSPSSGSLSASTLDRTLLAGAAVVIETTGLDSQAVQVGWAQLLTNGSVSGFAVFGSRGQEAVVPLETHTAASYTLWCDNTGGSPTGVALANIGTAAATIGVAVRDDNGGLLFSDIIVLPAHDHTSFMVSDRFSIMSNRRGTLEFQTPTNGQISVLGLSFTPTGAFTSVPVFYK